MREESFPQTRMAVTQVNALLRSVYNWMMVGLGLSGLTAYMTVHSDAMLNMIFGNGYMIWVLFIGEIGLVIALSGAVKRMSASTAAMLFMLFSVLNGLTLSSILLIYTARSVATTFFIAGATFGATSFYGYVTKKDLTSWGNFLFMGLLGLIIAFVVNIFWQNTLFDLLLSAVGVLIFVGLTAYDTQKIRQMGEEMTTTDSDSFGRLAILGALSLYLDFVNLFLMLLRFFGRRN